MHDRARAVLQFWIGVDPSLLTQDKTAWNPERKRAWFMGGKEVDDEVKATFLPDIQSIRERRYDSWLEGNNAHEAVAGLILMDQMTRNVYRGTAEMYSLDDRAVVWAKQLVETGADRASLALVERMWVYMPFMHSEQLQDQEAGIQHLRRLAVDAEEAGATGMAEFANFAAGYGVKHRDLVAKWGRFPHRNAILGVQSTPEEMAGLADGSIPTF